MSAVLVTHARLTLLRLLRGAPLLFLIALAFSMDRGPREEAQQIAVDGLLVLIGMTLALNARQLRTRSYACYLRTLPLGRDQELVTTHRLGGGAALGLGLLFATLDATALPERGALWLSSRAGMSLELLVEVRPLRALDVLLATWCSYWATVALQVHGRPRFVRTLGPHVGLAVVAALVFAFALLRDRVGCELGALPAAGCAALLLALGWLAAIPSLRHLARLAPMDTPLEDAA